MSRLAVRFLRAAENGDAARLGELLARGVPVNSRDPDTGATALHYAAAQGARRALRVLLRDGGSDHLIRDKQGRLPSELAGLYGNDPAMARLLLRKEAEQARASGVRLRRRDDPGAAPPRPQEAPRGTTRPGRPRHERDDSDYER